MPTRAQLEKTIRETTQGAIQKAFLNVVEDLRSKAEIGRIIRALEKGNIQAAVEAFNIEPAAFHRLESALERGVQLSGENFVSAISAQAQNVGLSTVIRFSTRNTAAENWLRQHSSGLVTGLVAEQREALQESLAVGMSQGKNPRTIALDVAGRLQGSKRVGGVIGLNSMQAEWLRNMEVKLSDPALMAGYAKSRFANKTYVKLINRAAKKGRKLTTAERLQILSRYSASLLKHRGTTVARTEMLRAFAASEFQAVQQAVVKLGLPDNAVTRKWDSSGDARVRHTHILLDENLLVGMHQPFVSALGSLMMFPGDTSLNAAAADTILCRCIVIYRLDYSKARR